MSDEKLTNIINLTSKMLLVEQQLKNPFVPNIPVSLLKSVYVKQLVAKFWEERVKFQKRYRLMNAYDLPDTILAGLFLECLMDQNWSELKGMKGNFLARVNIPGKLLVNIPGNVMVTAELQQPDLDDVNMIQGKLGFNALESNTYPARKPLAQLKVDPIEIVEQHKDVHEAVRNISGKDVHIVIDDAMSNETIEETVKDLDKKKGKTGKKWSLKRLLMNLCPCMRPRKDIIEV